MIKARATLENGEPLTVLGLSKMNLEKLQEGKPILFDNAELGLPGKTAILFGETEEDITGELAKLFQLPS